MSNQQKIAKLLDGFDISLSSLEDLNTSGTTVMINEATRDMKDKLFCPKCGVAVFRNPSEGIFSNGRKASFSHKQSEIPCIWRSKKKIGLHFENESEALHLIESDQLAIVSGFMQQQPEPTPNESGVYDQTPVESADGDNIDVPIPRHDGATVSLPSRIISVNGICRNFHKNYEKFFILPNQESSQLLSSILVNVEKLTYEQLTALSLDGDQKEFLYYGLITKVEDFPPKGDNNVRLVHLKQHSSVPDFCLRGYIGDLNKHGLTANNVGQYLLVWGKISPRGFSYCFYHPSWGEYGTLPSKYNVLLET